MMKTTGTRERGNAGTGRSHRKRDRRAGPRTSDTGQRSSVARAMRRTWAEVDLDAIAANVRAIRAMLAPACRIMAVVKADGYGHGAFPVAQAALRAGAAWLGVATVEEGLDLRRAGVTAPVLVLGPVDAADLTAAVRRDLQLTVTSPEAVAVLARAGRGGRVHLKIDTGMTRLGVLVDEVPAVLRALDRSGVRVEGCYTHLASAEEPDPAFTREQLNRFDAVLEQVRGRFPGVVIHVAGSGGILAHPRSHYDMVRLGLVMYGLHPADHLRSRIALRPAMRLMSRVVRTARVPMGTAVSYGATYRMLRPGTIATVPCGYADGYPRLAGPSAEVFIRGERMHIAGRVCMDYLMVDAGERPVRIGDPVELFGSGVSVDEVAAWAHTISYEVICGVGARVPRVYFSRGRPVLIRQS